jgi:hypothetical protein
MSKDQRYYPRFKSQLKTTLYIGGMFLVTVIYSLGLVNPYVRKFMLIMSLGYLAVIFMSFMGTVRKFNYIDLKRDGIHTTSFGFHKLLKWSDIFQKLYAPWMEVVNLWFSATPCLNFAQV